MISIGCQIKAARALLGLTRSDLAQHAGVHANAVKYWEGRNVPPDRNPPHAVERIEQALYRLGVVAFIDPRPGVCFCP